MGLEASTRVSGISAGGSAADKQFLDQRGGGYASNDTESPAPCSEAGELRHNHFAIFRIESVSVTSTQFAGGDWRWRLSAPDGTVLVEAGGYGSEAQCRDAVAILQSIAARATVA